MLKTYPCALTHTNLFADISVYNSEISYPAVFTRITAIVCVAENNDVSAHGFGGGAFSTYLPLDSFVSVWYSNSTTATTVFCSAIVTGYWK